MYNQIIIMLCIYLQNLS